MRNAFDRLAAGYDSPACRLFPFAADKLVEIVEPDRGARVLDIATGSAAVAIAAAQLIQPGGRVQAIDTSEAMLGRAQANIRKMALDNIDLFNMDAVAPEFRRDYFDVVLCGLGLPYLTDPQAALSKWLRITKPGGRLGISTYAAGAFNPLLDHLLALAKEAGLAGDDMLRATHHLDEPGQVEDMLHAAGWEGVTQRVVPMGYHLKAAEDWRELVWHLGAAKLEGPGADQVIKRSVEYAESLMTEKGIRVDVDILFFCANRPRDK